MYKKLKRIAAMMRNAYRRAIAPSQIRDYLKSHDIAKIQIGGGPNLLQGWLNTTLQPQQKGSMYMNAVKPFPIEDASFDYVFSEHMIEHVKFHPGQVMLSECFRVLKPGGRIRIATPDLKRMLSIYSDNPGPEEAAYIRWNVDTFLNDKDGYNPCFVINKIFGGWGHVFIYDRKTLQYALEKVGFNEVAFFAPGESNDVHFHDIEQHGKVIQSEPINQFETMVLEARKPD